MVLMSKALHFIPHGRNICPTFRYIFKCFSDAPKGRHVIVITLSALLSQPILFPHSYPSHFIVHNWLIIQSLCVTPDILFRYLISMTFIFPLSLVSKSHVSVSLNIVTTNIPSYKFSLHSLEVKYIHIYNFQSSPHLSCIIHSNFHSCTYSSIHSNLQT